MKRVFKNRLLKLANLLIADARKKKGVKFDLDTWAAPSTGAIGSLSGRRGYATRKKLVPVSCETHACAIGLACISGKFKRSGLSYRYVRNTTHDGQVFFFLEPKFKNRSNFEAVQNFLGINQYEAYRLFLGRSYAFSRGASAERAVAKRIRDFVKTGVVA
jgi:hypothetical protein